MTTKTIALIGQHGSGKSTLFDVLSDIKIPASGATVDFQVCEINLNGETVRLIDLPGIYSLNPRDPAEKITVDYLLNNQVDLIINVINAPMLARSLELTVELVEFGKPMVVALNMQDEAEQHGLKIDEEKLSKIIGVPVQPTTARFGKGTKKLADKCYQVLYNETVLPNNLKYTHHLEVKINDLIMMLNDEDLPDSGLKRFWAIKSIENPDLLPNSIRNQTRDIRKKINQELHSEHKIDAFETVSYERHHLAMKITEDTSILIKRNQRTLNEKFDDYLLHPFAGYIFLIGFFLLYFATIFVVGNFLASLVDAPISAIADTFSHLQDSQPFLWHTLNGAYMGFAGVLGIVLPYFLPLVFLTSLFEDTGYTSRIAFLVDGIMHKIGLHGKSVVPFILGFGCAIPALYATRIIESPRDRMLTGILIMFVPCSARIAVIFALTAAFAGPIWAFIVFVFIGLVIAVSGKVLSKLLSKPMGMIMEMNPLKLPSIKLSFRKTWFKIKDFVKEAIIFLVGGSIVLGWIEYFHVASYINMVFAPLLDFLLGLPEQLGSTLIFGFFRKELVIVMATQAMGVATLSDLPLTLDQVIVFIIFVSLYIPCFTTMVVLWKEFGTKTLIWATVFSMLVATISSFLFKIILGLI
jgi:ferrous iron transport protein B